MRNNKNKKSQRISAAIYPSCSINGYGAIWSLGRERIPVIALSPRKTYYFQSKFITESHITPDAALETENFVDFLIELGKQKKNKMVLYMMEDVYAFIASAYREELQKYYYYPYLNWQQLNATLNKQIMYEIAIDIGISAPKTWFPTDELWVAKYSNQIQYPVIIKPLISRFSFDNKKINQVVEFPNKYGKCVEIVSPKALCKMLSQIMKEGFSVCIQERIECNIDKLWTHNFYCDEHGEIIASFTGHKIYQDPPDFGTCVVGQAKSNSYIIERSQKFVKKINYYGIGTIEYIETAPHNYKFIEINPRGDFWNSLPTSCGVNLYKLMYDHILKKPTERYYFSQSKNSLLWYDFNNLHKFFKYKKREISIIRFLMSSKMEAIANLQDIKILIWRIVITVRHWRSMAMRALHRELD